MHRHHDIVCGFARTDWPCIGCRMSGYYYPDMVRYCRIDTPVDLCDIYYIDIHIYIYN